MRLDCSGPTPDRTSRPANLFEQEEALGRSAVIFRSLEAHGLLRLDGRQPVAELTERILIALRQGPLFDRLCRKRADLDRCEPAYCRFRMQGACAWVGTGALEPPPCTDLSDLAAAILADESVPLDQKPAALLERLDRREQGPQLL